MKNHCLLVVAMLLAAGSGCCFRNPFSSSYATPAPSYYTTPIVQPPPVASQCCQPCVPCCQPTGATYAAPAIAP